MRVSNLRSPRSGNPVANQYEISTKEFEYFQSYGTLIARRDNNTGSYTISTDWAYSRTTSKYFYQWLRTFGWNDTEIAILKKFLHKLDSNAEPTEVAGRSVSVKQVQDLK